MGQFPLVMHPAEVVGLLRDPASIRLLDVRTPAEFETVHIAGAYNVPLDTLAEHADEIAAAVAQPIVLICQSGRRARQAEEALSRAGLVHLRVLDGGMSGWLGAGLPVRRGRRKISLERQVRMAAGALAAVGGLLATFVNPVFGLLAAFVGVGLLIAGLTDTCTMAMLLAKLPYNRPAGCDIGSIVRTLTEHP